MTAKRTKPLQSAERKKASPATKLQQLLWNEKGATHDDLYPFSDISPALQLRHHARAKRLALRLDVKKRTVFLVIPKRTSLKSAYKFALEHKKWIKDRLDELPQQITFEHGNIIPLFGQKYTVNITCDFTLRKTTISLKNNKISVSTNKEFPEARIRRFIIDHARAELTSIAQDKADILGRELKGVDVKDTASRWGSCSHDGYISLSWRLAFASPEAFDYVVAHEVAHLAHMDHSPAFWKQCAALCDNYVRGKAWMKINAQELLKYD